MLLIDNSDPLLTARSLSSSSLSVYFDAPLAPPLPLTPPTALGSGAIWPSHYQNSSVTITPHQSRLPHQLPSLMSQQHQHQQQQQQQHYSAVLHQLPALAASDSKAPFMVLNYSEAMGSFQRDGSQYPVHGSLCDACGLMDDHIYGCILDVVAIAAHNRRAAAATTDSSLFSSTAMPSSSSSPSSSPAAAAVRHQTGAPLRLYVEQQRHYASKAIAYIPKGTAQMKFLISNSTPSICLDLDLPIERSSYITLGLTIGVDMKTRSPYLNGRITIQFVITHRYNTPDDWNNHKPEDQHMSLEMYQVDLPVCPHLLLLR